MRRLLSSIKLNAPVYRAVEILPDAFDQDAGLIHAPAPSRWALVFAKDLFKQWQKPDRPAVDRRMVDEHASLLHHFLKMAIAQWIRRVPTDAHQNDVDWESHSFGAQHLVWFCRINRNSKKLTATG